MAEPQPSEGAPTTRIIEYRPPYMSRYQELATLPSNKYVEQGRVVVAGKKEPVEITKWEETIARVGAEPLIHTYYISGPQGLAERFDGRLLNSAAMSISSDQLAFGNLQPTEQTRLRERYQEWSRNGGEMPLEVSAYYQALRQEELVSLYAAAQKPPTPTPTTP